MLNLVQNAFSVSDRVSLRGTDENGEAMLAVSDDGPGVPADQRRRIFEPFVTDKEQGAGLGLAIVKRVVEANGGRVELTSGGEGEWGGAEFRVYFRGGEDFHPRQTGS